MNNTTFVRTMLVGVAGLVIGISGTLVVLWQRPTENKPPGPVTPKEILVTTTPGVPKGTPDFNPPTTTLKADVVTTTAYLNGQKAIKYTDKIADFSVTVPATWIVEPHTDIDENSNESTYMIIHEPIIDTFRPFPKGFIIYSTQLPFEIYKSGSRSGPELPKLEFYKVASYKFKGFPSIHWEQDTHIGIKYTTDFILRKYKKYNIVIEQNGNTGDVELRQVINSLEL